jgi:hypothetical protein
LWYPAKSHGRSADPILTAWEYGAEKVRQGDVATGLAVLGNVIAHAPTDVAKRQALRELERTVCPKRESGNVPLVMMEVWEDIRQAKHKRSPELVDWDAIDRAAERGLSVDPWDVDLHCELGLACSKRGYGDAARFAYNCALQCAPDRQDIREHIKKLDG